MKLLVKPSTTKIEEYKNADAFLFGLLDYSYTGVINLSINEIKEITEKYQNKEIFISIDKNLFNKDLEELEKILKELTKINIKGIFFYDLGLMHLSKKLNINIPLIWNQNFFVTNYKTCNYYNSLGIKGAVISSEITIDEVIEIANNTSMTLFMNIFGYQLIGFSKRKLITNYLKYINEQEETNNHFMIEKEEKYPIKEYKEGTKILSNKVLNGILELEKIKNTKIEYLILNSEDIPHNDFIKVLGLFKQDKDIQQLNEEITKLIPNTSTLFLNKKTIYKVKRQ